MADTFHGLHVANNGFFYSREVSKLVSVWDEHNTSFTSPRERMWDVYFYE
jgi:hypothetical protein